MLRWCVCLVMMASSHLAHASRPAWTLQVDPLTTALGLPHLQVERAVTRHLSIYVGPQARLFDSLLSDEEEPYRGYGLEAGARWFWRGGAPEGPWAQLRGVGAYAVTNDGEDEALAGYISALAGWTGIFAGRWVLSGGAGVQYLRYRVADLGPKGVFPALHTAVEVAL